MSEKISLLLVGDQELLRAGMRIILDLEEDLTVVGEAGNGQEAIDLYAELRPDVVLMDVQMPVMNGIEVIRGICTQCPEAKILILTTFDHDEYIFEGIQAGALGYMLKAMSSSELGAAVRSAYRGGSWLEPSIARKIVDEFSRIRPLSPMVLGCPSRSMNGSWRFCGCRPPHPGDRGATPSGRRNSEELYFDADGETECPRSRASCPASQGVKFDITRVPLGQQLRDRFLTADGIDYNDTAGRIQHLQQFGNGANPVPFCIHLCLRQHHTIGHSPDTD